MDPDAFAEEFQRRFDQKMTAREAALPAARLSIRASANAIRAIHRGDMDTAHRLMDESRAHIDEAERATEEYPELFFAGHIQDAEKEYAEARLTEAVVTATAFPGPDEVGVGLAPYLNGMAEAIGEARRAILDLLRHGEVERSEEILQAMDDMYSILVSMDYPDAITGNLRRSTDVARSIMEKTRGDLSLSIIQRGVQDALERHAKDLHGRE